MNAFIPLSIAILAASATVASAANTFAFDRTASTDTSVTLTDVEADQSGRIDVYTYDLDGLGRFLGTAPIAAGTTGQVAINLNEATDGRVMVIMLNENHSVAKLRINELVAN